MSFQVILDIVYNHTNEADDKNPYTTSFRGIDNKARFFFYVFTNFVPLGVRIFFFVLFLNKLSLNLFAGLLHAGS